MKIVIFLSIIFTFKLSSCDDKCGGTFTGFQYQITSPNYPNNYPPNQDCVYTLKGSEFAKCDQDFNLQFLDFQLEASNGCAKDYVKVADSNIHCGNSIGIRKFKGRDKSLRLVFHSDKNTTAKGFRILVTTLSCAQEKQDDVNLAENQERGDQASNSRVEEKKLSFEKSRLPQSPDQDFHKLKNDDASDDDAVSVTSYLYLPPSPLKISGPQTPGLNNSSAMRDEMVIKHFEDQFPLAVTEPPTDFQTPHNQIPLPFADARLLYNTRKTFEPTVIRSSPFYDSSNVGWDTYGTPNSPSPNNPNNNYDPFANNNPATNYNPNCGGRSGNNNPNNYYPNNNNNNNNNNDWNPNYNPAGESAFGNVNPYYPADNGNSFDMNFAVNNYPNNNYYGNDDTIYTYESGSTSECCGTRYSSSNFLLTSPRFPALIYSSSNYECRYTIQRSSQAVCQLQMYLKFFNFGSDDRFCAYGHVEIDGRRYCGCQTGANITSSFDNIATKTITVKYVGYPKNKFSGFVIEVSQVSCSTSYLRWRNDVLHQQQNPAVLVRNYQRYYKKRSVNEREGGGSTREKREAGYYYDRPINGGLMTSQNLQFINTCRIFKFLNWVKAAKQVYLKSAQCSSTSTSSSLLSSVSVIPIFPDEATNSAIINFPSNSNCETVNLVEGTISSPYYPSDYSNNLNQCYRFYKAPGFCQLEFAVLDFDLESSTICRKDYVTFSGQKRRYCGTSLAGSRTIIDMTRTNFVDLYFVTDSSGTGRGFKAGFSQISC